MTSEDALEQVRRDVAAAQEPSWQERAETAEARLHELSLAFPVLRLALAVAIGESDWEAEAAPYRDALRVLGGEETQERSDEKERS